MAFFPNADALTRTQEALAAIAAGPSAKDLAGAPVLTEWMVCPHAGVFFSLQGLSTGHPELTQDGAFITTSIVLGIDPQRRWARTLSRWYRLATPADPQGDSQMSYLSQRDSALADGDINAAIDQSRAVMAHELLHAQHALTRA